MSNIYSVIQCIGKDAGFQITKQYKRDISGMYAMRKISDNNQIIWFSYDHKDFGKHITIEFLLDELQRLGGGKIYNGNNLPDTTFSGTIIC